MDKKNYQKPSIKEVVVEEHLLIEPGSTSGGDPSGGGSRVSRDFGEEE